MNEKLQRLMERNGINSIDKPDLVQEVNTKLDAFMEYMGVQGRWNGQVFEVIKPTMESGDYTNPIQIPAQGIAIVTGKWYYTTDKELPHEAKQDAFVTIEDFNDRMWFDFV